MLKHMLAITVAVAAISFAAPGVGNAASACSPHCEPAKVHANLDKGLAKAKEVAGTHGEKGRANAADKRGLTPPPPPPPTGGGGTGTGGGPCEGC